MSEVAGRRAVVDIVAVGVERADIRMVAALAVHGLRRSRDRLLMIGRSMTGMDTHWRSYFHALLAGSLLADR